jgi:hypothetical protein
MPEPSPKLGPATDAVLRRTLTTPPQPMGVVKARSVREATEKAPRVGGAEVKRGRLMKGTDWLKAHPAMLVAGSLVDRNAVFSLDVARQATRNPTTVAGLGGYTGPT